MPSSKCKCFLDQGALYKYSFLISCLHRDWKKLTFYYFADSYINFNSLVTDLFKIYKTRIWMSAINPASFVTPPSAGLQPSGALGYGQEGPSDRRQHDRAFGNGREAMEAGREFIPNPMLRNSYADNYQPFGQGPRHPEAGPSGFGGLQGQGDPFSAYAPTNYGSMETGYADYANSPRIPSVPGAGDWASRFQGLSLGS